MRLLRPLLTALALLGVLPTVALAGHGLLDHPAPSLPTTSQPNPAFQAEGGTWQLLGSIPTGNPHTDLDFFTRGGETFASVGTLATGPNRGGQTVVKLTDGGEVKNFKIVGSAPTAACASSPVSTLGLQHDVEATPKGRAVLNTFNPFVDADDAQLLVDATDGPGRCHDQGTAGLSGAPQGGLELLDITDPANPVTIGLTSHVGQAHTVNIDPKRPHIAYVSSSDQVTLTDGKRSNETSATSTAVDGIEVVDMSSCMNFADGTSVEQKRMACDPKVFRYRYPTAEMGLGHTRKTNLFGCHELEIYPNDRVTCGAGTALINFDFSGAFDDRGTPDDYTDDQLRGTPLPCRRRESSSSRLVPAGPSFFTAAQVVDCVAGGANGTINLRVAGWKDIGSPSLEGVRWLGSVHHQGGTDQADPNQDLPPSEDIIFDHEAELSQSGNLLIASDERGGGATPPGATCSANNSNPVGNGGLSFYRADRSTQQLPANAEEAFRAYARTPQGGKAIYRAPVRTGAQAVICTAHVFQQIPGQNRIFMGWYSQGTQVIDFTENPDGTVSLKEVGSFIPASANQWVSHVFKTQENPDGTFTYFGAAADLRLGESGRNTIDVYKVTLPAPPKPADGPGVLPERVRGTTVTDPQTGRRVLANTQTGGPTCSDTRAIQAATVKQSGRRVALGFRASAPVTIDLFQQSAGRRVIGERLVKRFSRVRGALRWNGRDRRGARLRDGFYVARFAAPAPAGGTEYRRVALERRNGRFRTLPTYSGQDTCGLVRTFKLERPVFGGRSNRALNIAFRLGDETRGTVTVTRAGGKVVKTFPERAYRGGQTHRLRLTAKATRFPPGRYVVTLTVRSAGGETATRRLTAFRL